MITQRQILFFTWTLLFNVVFAEELILRPDRSLDALSITPGETLRFLLEDLKPKSHYEVRISYPANYPTIFHINFDERESTGRSLLNIEKISFITDKEGLIEGKKMVDGRYHLTVRAEFESVSPPGGVGPRPVPFNIVLETLFYGVPFESLKVVGLIIVGVIVSLIFLPAILSLLRGSKKRKID